MNNPCDDCLCGDCVYMSQFNGICQCTHVIDNTTLDGDVMMHDCASHGPCMPIGQMICMHHTPNGHNDNGDGDVCIVIGDMHVYVFCLGAKPCDHGTHHITMLFQLFGDNGHICSIHYCVDCNTWTMSQSITCGQWSLIEPMVKHINDNTIPLTPCPCDYRIIME